MSIQSVARLFSLLLLVSLPFGKQAMAQGLGKSDVAINVFGQFTSTVSGNGITDTPSRSMGPLFTFRQSYKPWLGYEVNYSYTRFSETYTGQIFRVQNNVHEATGAFLVQGPKFFGLQVFGAAGTGLLVFLPTTVGGQHNTQQYRYPFLYEVGVNHPLLVNRLGVRVQYRGLIYKAPDYGLPQYRTGATRQTPEVTVGLFLRF
ncbi:MAG TPA: hypothetical protein VGM27_26230 [Acidobacteriaceae bacterium]